LLLFDEAHNVAEAACEGRSIEMDNINIDGALLELNKILHSNFLSASLYEVKINN